LPEAEDEKGGDDARRSHTLALRTEPAPSPYPTRFFRNGRGWTDQQTAGCANLPAMTRGALFDAFACKLIAIRAKVFVISRLAQLFWLFWHRPIP